MDIERTKFPSAARLLRFINAATRSKTSPIWHLSRFYKIAEQQVAGPWWTNTHEPGSRVTTARRPVNPLGEMVRTYHPHLIGDKIAPAVEPRGLGTRSGSKMLEYALNQWCDDSKYAQTRERVVLDSLLACGFYYVFRREGGMMIATEKGTADLGQPDVSWVSIQRMVVDPNAETWENPTGIGHWVELDRQSMLAHGIGNEAILNSMPNIWEDMHETRDETRRQDAGDTDQYLGDPVLGWEFTFTHLGKRFGCMLPPVEGVEGFIIDPYPLDDEPEGSRYVHVALDGMSSSLTPVSPCMVKMDEHLARVGVYAKIMKQIEDLERRYVIKPGAQDMVMRLKDRNADGFVTGDPDSVKEFVLGGMLKELVEAQSFLRIEGQQSGPNTELAGGRTEPGKTATSNAILAGNAAVAMNKWKNEVAKADETVLRRVAAMRLKDGDTQTFPFTASSGQVYPLTWTANTKDISYDQYRFRIRAYSSTAAMDPRAKLLGMFQVLAALPGVLQTMCGMLGADPSKVLRVVSDMADMPELDEMLPSADSQQIQTLILQHLQGAGMAQPGAMGPAGTGIAQNLARPITGMPGMGGTAPAPALPTGNAPPGNPNLPMLQQMASLGAA